MPSCIPSDASGRQHQQHEIDLAAAIRDAHKSIGNCDRISNCAGQCVVVLHIYRALPATVGYPAAGQ